MSEGKTWRGRELGVHVTYTLPLPMYREVTELARQQGLRLSAVLRHLTAEGLEATRKREQGGDPCQAR